MTAQRKKRVTFRPYAFEPLSVRLSVGLRDIAAVEDEVNLSLAVDELQQWDRLHAVIEADVTSSSCRGRLENEDALLWVTARCAPTRWRSAVRLVGDGDVWRGEVELPRDAVRDFVSLEPKVVVCRDFDETLEVGQTIAEGRAWTIRTDPHRARASGYLQIRYRSFSESPDIMAPDAALYWLDFDSSEPVLWLNEDHEMAAVVLQARGTRGLAARARDVVFDSLTQAVWTQLFVAASESYDGTDEPKYPWHRTVVESMARRMYPEVPAAEAVLHMMQEREFAGLAYQLSRLDVVLQERNELARHIERLAVEGDL